MDVINKTNSKDRRQQIIDAASDLFRKQGYYGTRMTDIAHYIGVTKPVVYRFFDSKEKLFSEWFEDSVTHEYDQLIDYINNSKESARVITKVTLDKYFDMIVSSLILTPYKIAIMEAGICPEITKIVYDKMQIRFLDAMHALFERAQKNKELKELKEFDVKLMVNLFVAPICASLVHYTVFGYEKVDPERLKKFYDAHHDSFWMSWAA